MKLRLETSLVLALMMSSLYAQTPAPKPMLKGRVVRADSGNGSGRLDREIRITVKDKDTGRLVEGEQPATKVEDWFHVADVNSLVNVEFDGGPCYEYDGHSNIRVKPVNPSLGIVKLQKTRECKTLEELQQRRDKRPKSGTTGVAATRADSGTTVSGGATIRPMIDSIDTYEPQHTASRPVKITRIDPTLDADLIPSPPALRQEIETEADRARIGQFFDTFQYKFALKSELYGETPELVRVLTEFREKPENADLFQPIGKLRPEMFNDVVRRQFQTSKEVNLEHVRMVLQEESASESIRGSATVALLNGSLDDNLLKEIRVYYREQTPSSPIFASSLIALGRIGEDEDKVKLYSYAVNSSGSDRLLAMEALSAAQLIEGHGALPDGAKTLASVATGDDDPEVRAFAIHSLRPFAYQQDQAALTALFSGVKDPDSGVRAQAALAFGVGEVEREPRVRNLLLKLMRNDPSPQVREAARLSLAGVKTAGLFLAIPGSNTNN